MSDYVQAALCPSTHQTPGPALSGCREQSGMGREAGYIQSGEKAFAGEMRVERSTGLEVRRPKTASKRRWFCCEFSRRIGLEFPEKPGERPLPGAKGIHEAMDSRGPTDACY